MEVIHLNNNEIKPILEPLCCAIGNFDGVHLGHQKLINESRLHGYKSAVLTFNPHPSIFLKKINNYPLLTPLLMKEKIISGLGIDYLIILEMNDEVLKYSKERFMDLLDSLNIKSIVCGYDFTFGYKALGNISDLKERFKVFEISKYTIDDIRVSSTYIKELLSSGNIKEANHLLGHDYSIIGNVTYGRKKGRLIGFPTANLYHDGYYLPKNGVYFVTVKYKDNEYLGMCNIGHNPTFNFQANLSVEVHIFDFDLNIYDDIIWVSFKEKIRDEKKFSSVLELKNQLEEDKMKCILLGNFKK